jgi:hypothetical protein
MIYVHETQHEHPTLNFSVISNIPGGGGGKV